MSHHSRSSLHSSRKSSASKTNIAGLSTSKRNVAFDSKLDKPVPPKKNLAQVLDEFGEDVTPKSLLPTQVTEAAAAAAANAPAGSATGKVQGKGAINFNDTASIQTPSDLFNQSGMYGAASTYQRSSYAAGFSQSLMSSMLGSRASLDSITDEIAEPSQGRVEPSGLQGISRQAADTKEVLTKEDLELEITVTLSETETIWHLDLPGISVQTGTPEADIVSERNTAYEKLLESRAGNDMFVERGMQTYNDAPKNKEVQTETVGMKDADCMATTWDMYETYNEKEKKKVVDQEEDDLLESTAKKLNANESLSGTATKDSQVQAGSTVPESKASFMSASHASVAGFQTADQAAQTSSSPMKGANELDVDEEAKRLFKMDSMKENVFIMERTIVQNIFHQRQAAYRGLPPLTTAPPPTAESEGEQKDEKPAAEEDLKIGPNLSRLWSYACPDTKGKHVNCMGWNKVNKDLLAVGYGAYDHNAVGKGILCVWSIKNPEHPERIYETRCAVTSLDFSMGHPNLLAVGLYDGTVQVFNIRNTDNSPILDSLENPGKHFSAVWELMWVERDKGTGEEKGEVLISGSGDGRITQWTIRKGFESLDMLKLKRVNVAKQSTTSNKKSNEASSSKKSDALISRYTSGMCFDFHTKDGNIYMVGTEEGHIHKCSCSYNEQFLDTYTAHTGPVYRVIWSPFDESAFLSCSADWSICLWHQDKLNPLLTLQAASKAIHSIDWSPKSPTMFAAVNDDQIEIWDLAVSILDPLLVNLPISKASLTSVLFAQNSEALLVGDAEGQVTIYYMREMPPVKAFKSDWLSSIATSKTNHAEEEAE